MTVMYLVVGVVSGGERTQHGCHGQGYVWPCLSPSTQPAPRRRGWGAPPRPSTTTAAAAASAQCRMLDLLPGSWPGWEPLTGQVPASSPRRWATPSTAPPWTSTSPSAR
jgi:hypothetical protein